MKSRGMLFCSVAALTLCCAASPASAAPAGPAIAEVVVTAQRRSERLEDVPMSVTAVSPQMLEKAGVVNIHDIGSMASGVQVNFAGGFTQPAMRGITTLTTGAGFENNVAIYVDGFYTPDNLTANMDLANIESIQILKGPQGTLWGRNATGGAILVTTLAPSKTLTGKIEGAYGRYNERTVEGFLSGPISDRIRYSLAGYLRTSDGYNKLLDIQGAKIADANPIKQASIRTKLEADLSENLTATVALNETIDSDPRGLWYAQFQYRSPIIPGPPLSTGEPFVIKQNHAPHSLAITDEGTLKLAWRTGVGVLTSYTGYAYRRYKYDFDFDGSYADINYTLSRWREKTVQENVDYNIDAIKNVDLVLGGSYYFDRTASASDSYANFAYARTNSGVLRSTALAGFADATIHLSDRWALSVGARYSHEKKTANYMTVNNVGVATLPRTLASKSFSAFTPRASLRYEISPRTNIYAAYSKGFRTGGFNPSPPATAALALPFDPEKITAYEVGFKTAALPWLRYEMAAFYYDYRNLQVGVTVPRPDCAGQPGCSVVQVVLNAPKAEVYGLDNQLTMRLGENLNIRAGAAWLHARYRNFPNATGNGLNATTGLNVANQVQDWSNQEMARAPRFSGSLGADYTIDGVAGGAVQISGNLRYTGSFVLSNPSLYGPLAGAALATKQRYRIGAYSIFNGQISWTDQSGHYKASVYGQNLFDKRYFLTYNGGAFGDYRNMASPRTYGVRLGYSF